MFGVGKLKMAAAFEKGEVDAIRPPDTIGCSKRSSQPAGTSVSLFKIATWPDVACIAWFTVATKPRFTVLVRTSTFGFSRSTRASSGAISRSVLPSFASTIG